jgi:hypothetical protein
MRPKQKASNTFLKFSDRLLKGCELNSFAVCREENKNNFETAPCPAITNHFLKKLLVTTLKDLAVLWYKLYVEKVHLILSFQRFKTPSVFPSCAKESLNSINVLIFRKEIKLSFVMCMPSQLPRC